jgi:hypothetical protein
MKLGWLQYPNLTTIRDASDNCLVLLKEEVTDPLPGDMSL